MGTSLFELKSTLLDLLFLKDIKTLPGTDHFGKAEWATLQSMIAEHRLGPIMHWRLTHVCQSLWVPQELREFCARSFKAATIRSLMLQSELLQVHHILKSAGIKYVALKGAWLAFYAYPHPGLRPMRDLDLLAPKEDILTAYHALLDKDYERLDQYKENVESAIKIKKHLPPMRSGNGTTRIELHHRLSAHNTEDSTAFDLAEDECLWQRVITEKLAGAEIPYLDATEQLLHLIVHGVYDHQFTNGPLLISDIGYLLLSQRVNWDYFWELTERGDYQPGAILALKLLERFWGEQEISWPETMPSEDESLQRTIDTTIHLILRDSDLRSDIRIGQTLQDCDSRWQQIKFLLSRAFLSKAQIAGIYPVSEDSLLVYAWYPVRWWRLISKRFPQFLKNKQKDHWQSELTQVVQINAWLKSKRPVEERDKSFS